MLFEDVDGELRYVAGDDDSGEDRNALVRVKLFRGRTYVVRLRLYPPGVGRHGGHVPAHAAAAAYDDKHLTRRRSMADDSKDTWSASKQQEAAATPATATAPRSRPPRRS